MSVMRSVERERSLEESWGGTGSLANIPAGSDAAIEET